MNSSSFGEKALDACPPELKEAMNRPENSGGCFG
jgi:hypothetical protein